VHRETKRTIVYVTHDSDEAFYLATRVAVLHAGQIQQIGDPQSVFCKPSTKDVGKLLGQPTLDLIELPMKWFDATQESETGMSECGVRSHDWRIEDIDTAVRVEKPTRELRFSIRGDVLHLSGAIAGCRWMGSRWMLEIDCPQRIRITCASPTTERLETSLLAIMNSVRSGKQSKCLGYVTATTNLSCIQKFDRNVG